MIRERIRQEVYVKNVAAELGVHPRTVSRDPQEQARSVQNGDLALRTKFGKGRRSLTP
jgi:hypothetical protein